MVRTGLGELLKQKYNPEDTKDNLPLTEKLKLQNIEFEALRKRKEAKEKYKQKKLEKKK